MDKAKKQADGTNQEEWWTFKNFFGQKQKTYILQIEQVECFPKLPIDRYQQVSKFPARYIRTYYLSWSEHAQRETESGASTQCDIIQNS